MIVHSCSGGPENIEYAHIHAKILDASDGTEDGQLEFGAITAGSLVEPVLTINGTEVESNKPLKVSADFLRLPQPLHLQQITQLIQ